MSLKRKFLALMIASIGVTVLPSLSHAQPFDTGDTIYLKPQAPFKMCMGFISFFEG